MPVAITMPRLSDSMEEGTVVTWLVAVGASVARGQPLVEIDTDKATMEYEAETTGTLLATMVAEGADAPVGAVICWIGDPGEEVPAAEEAGESAASAPPSAAPARAAAPVQPARSPSAGGGRVNASPVARRLAQDLGVDLARLTGTGPGGAISRDDVLAAADANEESAAEPPASTARGEIELLEPSRLQRTVARRMVEGSEAPDFAVEADVDMTACMALRAALAVGDEPAATLNDLVIKASALALRDFPRVNGSFTEAGFELHGRVNVGVAVATDDGLVVPTVFDADTTPLADIARATRDLAAKVRDGTITPAELDGGTFTVSNLGMLGVRRFFPILNPPQAAILGVGAAARRPVVAEDGSIETPWLASLVLVCDHRIVYGADAARFLARLRELLEQPAALVA